MRKKSSTCLAVIKDPEGFLWMAGDRRISIGNLYQKNPTSKVSLNNGVLLGTAGACVTTDLITEQFDVPDNPYNLSPREYVHKIFTNCLVEWLRAEGWVQEGTRRLSKDPDSFTAGDLDGVILLGVQDVLFELCVTSDIIAAVEVNTPYTAGCGGEVALGSLITLDKIGGMKPKQKLQTALSIAATCCLGCDDSVDIINNKGV